MVNMVSTPLKNEGPPPQEVFDTFPQYEVAVFVRYEVMLGDGWCKVQDYIRFDAMCPVMQYEMLASMWCEVVWCEVVCCEEVHGVN